MPHGFEIAPSGRAKCRGCGATIAKGDLRFGERLPNPFGEGEMTLWFHPMCGVYKRPEALLEALSADEEALASVAPEERERWGEMARFGIVHRRLPRVNGAERASSARARCRSCREPIAKDSWRIPLVFFEEGYFSPSGYVHPRCARDYFETIELLDRLRRFSPSLSEDDLKEIRGELESDPART